MDCCNKNRDNGRNGRHAHRGHMPHMWMMALCCGVPVILILAVSLMGAGLPGLKAVLLGIAPFICPVMMIAMLPMMFMHGKRDSGRHAGKQEAPKITGNNLEK